jgi:hypothetical protein
MKSLQVLLSTLALIIVAAALTVGCGDGDVEVTGPDGNLPGSEIGHDSRLVLGDGYAWVGVPDEESDDNVAFILNANGTGRTFVKFDVWTEVEPLKWYTAGGKIYMINTNPEDGEADTSESTYTLSGNTLTVVEDGVTIVFTKTPFDIDDIGGGEVDPDLIEHDSRLVLGDGYAWVGGLPDEEFPVNAAFILNANGSGRMFVEFGVWMEAESFEWYTAGGKIYMINTDPDDGVVDTSESTYTLSGNTLTIVDDGMTIVFTKEPFNIDDIGGGEIDPELTGKAWADINLVTGEVAMWSFSYEEGDPLGVAMFVTGVGDDEPVYEVYICRTSGGAMILTPIDVETMMPTGEGNITYEYSISGGVLTLNGKTYTDMSGGGLFKKNLLMKAPDLKLPRVSLLK